MSWVSGEVTGGLIDWTLGAELEIKWGGEEIWRERGVWVCVGVAGVGDNGDIGNSSPLSMQSSESE